MSGLEVVPLSDDHVGDAARLLARRHRRQRQAEPLLPETFEAQDAAAEAIAAALHEDGAIGVAGLRGGRLVGYLVGAPRDAEVWGENVWVEPAGYAVAEPEDLRDLYAAAATRWVEDGHRRHYALVPATEASLVDAWRRLSFAHQQTYGLREVTGEPQAHLPEGVEIRAPRPEDVDALLDVDFAIALHQRASPVFSERPLPTAESIRREWASTLSKREEHVLIACAHGRPVACWSVWSAELSPQVPAVARPDRACYLGFASTLPEARGLGIGLALTAASLAAARKDGYEAMVTDWRIANLLASRFWLKRGFRPALLRLFRPI